VSLKRGPLSLVNTIEELLGRNGSGSGLESRKYSRRDSSRRPLGTLHPQKLALTSPSCGGRSVGIIHYIILITLISIVITTAGCSVVGIVGSHFICCL
jgi:hypothetical protein